jgi:CheY-like chemotaxis protein
MTPVNILIVDDNPADVALIRHMLKRSSSVEVAQYFSSDDLESTLQQLSEQPIDCILLDYMLGATTGLEVLKGIRNQHSTPILFLTGYDDQKISQEALQQGAEHYLSKGNLTREHLEQSIQQILQPAHA